MSLALVAAAGASSWGCRQNPSPRPPEVRIAEAVDEKLVAWRQRRRTECRRVALAEAQLLADTLIMDYALAKRLESPRPSRPIRPEEPPLLRPDDTLRLDPFRTDTLIRPDELPRRRIRADVRRATGGAGDSIAPEPIRGRFGSGGLDGSGEPAHPTSDTVVAPSAMSAPEIDSAKVD